MRNRINKFDRFQDDDLELNFDKRDRGKTFKIYLDMDGCITDFQGDFQALKTNKKGLRFEEWDKVYGRHTAWAEIGKAGLEHWEYMSWMPDGKELWNYLKEYNPTILSAPSRDPRSARGKILWVNRELGLNVDSATRSAKGPKWAQDSRMILSAQKYMFAKRYPNSILIDDTANKIRDWQNNGGIGILHTDTESTIAKLEEILAQL
jgi:hypothetical protein